MNIIFILIASILMVVGVALSIRTIYLLAHTEGKLDKTLYAFESQVIALFCVIMALFLAEISVVLK